jgi:hypothetical protein
MVNPERMFNPGGMKLLQRIHIVVFLQQTSIPWTRK